MDGPQPPIPGTAAAAAAAMPVAAPHMGPAAYAPTIGYSQGLGLGKPAGVAPVPSFSQNVTRTSPVTVTWLHENFEAAEGVSLGRSTLYQHYCDHCTLHRYDPVNQASFGKLIRSVFPNLKTRRLGTRGNSKYHYYGIRLKDSSPLTFPSDQIGGAHNRYRSRAPNEKTQPKVKKAGPASAKPEQGDVEAFLNGSLALPDFPPLPGDEFGRLYHANCKEVVRLASKAEFPKIQALWEKFWATQTRPLLTSPTGISYVVRCDEIFLPILARTLMFDVLAPMPESLVRELRFFSKCLEAWTKTAMAKLPVLLEERLKRIRPLAHSLRRFTTLNHLAQAARPVLGNSEQTTQMFIDLSSLEFAHINAQARGACGCDGRIADSIEAEFKRCLQLQHTAEQWFSWLQKVLRDFVGASEPVAATKNFILRWTLYTSLVVRDLTLRSAPSFGAFHLCLLYFDECLVYLAEQVGEKGLSALSLEYRPLARRPAPVAAEDGEGDDMDDLDEQEDYEIDDGESRTGFPVLSNFVGQLGGGRGGSPFGDYMHA